LRRVRSADRTRARALGVSLGLALLAGGCGGNKGAGELHARKKTLEREVQGLREVVSRLERGEPGLPAGDVVIAVEDGLLRTLLEAQLPLEADVDRFHVRLDKAEVAFRGSPLVNLEGKVGLRDQSGLESEMRLLGALVDIRLDPATGTLLAAIAVDHIDLKKVAGLEQLLSGATLDDLARTLRLELASRLPAVAIPVKVEQRIELPALTSGPVRIAGASMPLEVEVSQVLAVRGTLWVGVRVKAGEFGKASAQPDGSGESGADSERPRGPATRGGLQGAGR
jgi:hypothetical protein